MSVKRDCNPLYCPIMISKSEVKYIQSLSQKKNRDAEGVFIVETPKGVNELLQSGAVINHIYATEGWQLPTTIPVSYTLIPEYQLQRISQLQTPQSVLAIAKKPPLPALSFNNQLTLLLDGIQDPGNLGTILRTADWFGISNVIATTDTADCYNPKVVQSAMGSVLRVHVWYTADAAALVAGAGVPVYGALLQGENVYTKRCIQEGLLLIGNESKGIRPPLLPLVQHPVTIPRVGKAESLNAAVAASIIIAQFRAP